ncbi:MAG: glycosyltransferase family 2 protein [Anaerolineales bacterium]|nr:glycosyltransferase family 2 protein [Anaerolineales bacterium]
MNLKHFDIAAVIPAYRVEREIEEVLAGLPDTLKHIIVVDDCSPDRTGELVRKAAEKDPRVILVRHEKNQGVGGAMLTGFRKALDLGVQVVVKIDGDGQMDPAYIPALVSPLLQGKADYAKGNRFRDFEALREMPVHRRMGNMGLSFLSKAVTGYWNCFDPTNGYFAIRAEVLELLPFTAIAKTYYFETSMLAELYLLGASVIDIPIPARYREETSNIVLYHVMFEFPFKLTQTFLRRMVLKNFLYDFSMLSIYLLTGLPLFFFGLIFGTVKWVEYYNLGVTAPTGTVMLATLPVILGIQILLAAAAIDLQSIPKEPLSKPLV